MRRRQIYFLCDKMQVIFLAILRINRYSEFGNQLAVSDWLLFSGAFAGNLFFAVAAVSCFQVNFAVTSTGFQTDNGRPISCRQALQLIENQSQALQLCDRRTSVTAKPRLGTLRAAGGVLIADTLHVHIRHRLRRRLQPAGSVIFFLKGKAPMASAAGSMPGGRTSSAAAPACCRGEVGGRSTTPALRQGAAWAMSRAMIGLAEAEEAASRWASSTAWGMSGRWRCPGSSTLAFAAYLLNATPTRPRAAQVCRAVAAR